MPADHGTPFVDLPDYAELPADFVAAVLRTEDAGRKMRHGDPVAYIAQWAQRDDVTLFGAWGPSERGTADLAKTFHWVGSRFADGDVSPEYLSAHCAGDLGVTIGFERGVTSVDGDDPTEMVIRVTHVYRHMEGDWFLSHRHADFPPLDQRVG